MTLVSSFQAEWLKRKRSLASWLVLVGAFFTPAIILASRIKNHAALSALYVSEDFWRRSWMQAWESMEVFLLPIGIILATGLIAQIEYKNNTWKQLHTTPQGFTTIFAAKLLVVLLMLVEVFALFNVGVYLSAVIPALPFGGLPYPTAPIPFKEFWAGNVNFFVDCLPIVALQYLLSLQFRNFLEYSYLFPYNHGAINFLTASGHFAGRKLPVGIELLALGYAAAFTIAGWALYVTRGEKG
jgi:hypothetical protein